MNKITRHIFEPKMTDKKDHFWRRPRLDLYDLYSANLNRKYGNLPRPMEDTDSKFLLRLEV